MSNVFRNYIFIYYRNNHKCNIGTVGTRYKDSGPYIAWAYNLFVVGLRISYNGSFSAERLEAILKLKTLSP